MEKNGSRVFANVPTDNSVVNVIDRKTGELAKWDLNGTKANFPIILDERSRRLFVVTRTPPLVVVLNTDTGKEVARVRVKAASDDAYFDADHKRIYVICGEGYISVIQQNDPDHYALIENIATITGARTGGLLGANFAIRSDRSDRPSAIMGLSSAGVESKNAVVNSRAYLPPTIIQFITSK